MWLCINDAFLSIVSKDCARDELLVRARRKGDIEKIFPGARVVVSTKTDYRFRAVVKRNDVADALRMEVSRITYENFKDSVTDKPLHDAYLRVWTVMETLQPGARNLFSASPPTLMSGEFYWLQGAVGCVPFIAQYQKENQDRRGRPAGPCFWQGVAEVPGKPKVLAHIKRPEFP